MTHEISRILIHRDIRGYELKTPLYVFRDADWQQCIGVAHVYFDGNALLADIESNEDISGLYPAIMHLNKSVKGISVSSAPNEDEAITPIKIFI